MANVELRVRFLEGACAQIRRKWWGGRARRFSSGRSRERPEATAVLLDVLRRPQLNVEVVEGDVDHAIGLGDGDVKDNLILPLRSFTVPPVSLNGCLRMAADSTRPHKSP